MSIETLFALSLFALVTSITPGPNNLMLLASGVNFGFQRSIPHMLGISVGFFVLVVAVGLGLAKIFEQLPLIYNLLTGAGVVYMLYLAWGIAVSTPPADSTAKTQQAKPLGFWGAALFQWVNPKAWIMAISTFSAYVPASSGLGAIVFAAGAFAIINLPSVSVWTLFGTRLRHFLKLPRNLKIFNYSMALLLVLSLYPLLPVPARAHIPIG